MVAEAARELDGIDLCVNNASAISLTGTLDTTMKRFDLMTGVNSRGTFCVSRACMPHLLQSEHPHVLTLSPPLSLEPRWFANHAAYTLSKYGMSLLTLGLSAEFDGKVGVNSLWPRTTIATAAVSMLGGQALLDTSRTPEIMADAAWIVLSRDPRTTTGNFYIDEDVLLEEGITDLDRYAVRPGTPLTPDLFV